MRRLALYAVALLLAVPPADAAAGRVDWTWGGPQDLVMAPDGKHLYAVGVGTTLTFDRDTATGGLAIADERGPAGTALVLSPDGRHAYMAAGNGRGLVQVLSVDRASGALAHESSFTTGLGQSSSLVLSPDGRHLYVTSNSDQAIAILERDPEGGGLRRADVVFGGPGDVEWLTRPWDIAMAPDGRSVYVALDNGLGGFSRDSASGALTPLDDMPKPSSTLFAVTVSPDGSRVYAGSGSAGAWYRDAGTGALTPAPGREGGASPPPPCSSSFHCGLGRSIVVSPDSGVVVSGRIREKTMLLARHIPEGLEHEAAYTDGESGTGLDGLTDFAWSPDGRDLYTVAGPNSTFPFGSAGRGVFGLWRRTPGQAGLTPIASFSHVQRPWPSQPAVTINDGALFTNSPRVRLTVRMPYGYSSVRLSNDEGAAGAPARRLALDDGHDWTLVDAGLARDVRRVYVRPVSSGSPGSPDLAALSDDIVLDQRLPVVAAARLRGAAGRGVRAGIAKKRPRSRLTLRARDNRSGVRRVQVTTRRARAGKKLRYRRRMAVRGNPRRVWVRVFDGAGNHSRWRLVRRRSSGD